MASSVTRATTPAATPAATPAVNSGDLVNLPAGSPAQEIWPSAVDPGQYNDAGPDYPIEFAPYGSWFAEPFVTTLPESSPGGGIQDTSWQTGTDGPQVEWDSAAGIPFTPSRAVNPLLHAEDTGAVYQKQYVIPAEIGLIRRHTGVGQTYNREYAFEPVQGQWVPALNGREDYDQRQTWDPSPHDGGGWAPWDPGYSERPIYNNVAYTATSVTSQPSQYGVSGDLPDRSQFNSYAAQAYEAPADPQVANPGAPAADTGGGWLLG